MDMQSTRTEILDRAKLVGAVSIGRLFGNEPILYAGVTEQDDVTFFDTAGQFTLPAEPEDIRSEAALAVSSSLYTVLGRAERGSAVRESEVYGSTHDWREYMDHFVGFLGVMLPGRSAAESMVDYLERETATSYARIPQVRAIYAGPQESTHKTVILLSSLEYDDELMDRLLSLEYRLHKQFSELLLSFSYIPLFDRKKEDIIHPAFRLLFER